MPVIKYQEFIPHEVLPMFEPDANLTDLAYEFGYADQAHFIHDFKAFTRLRRNCFGAGRDRFSIQLLLSLPHFQKTVDTSTS